MPTTVLKSEQFLDLCLKIFDLCGTLYEIVATVNQEEVGHRLDVIEHQTL
jgi:hypothetical protein